MLALPKLEVSCKDKFREEALTLAFRQKLSDWQPPHKTLFILDEPWGYAFETLESPHDYAVTVAITQNPTPEYWADLLRFNPSVLLAGEQTMDSVIQALKLATPERTIRPIRQT